MQRQLLHLLADGRQHSGSALAAALGVTRAAVWKQIEQLRELGIAIQAQPGSGYSLPGGVELLERDRILAALPAGLRAVAADLRVEWVIESTSDELLRNGRTEPGRARICLAEYQTGGRGRRGRQWFAALGSSLCVSVGWCFPTAPASLSCLGLAVGVAVLRAVRSCGIDRVQLKWPNDLIADDRKLAGVLVDVHGEAGGPLQVVAGVGLNYAPNPAGASAIVAAGGLAPVSLAELADRAPPARNAVAAELIGAMLQVLQQFELSGFAALADEWQSVDYLRGKPVKVVAGDSIKNGVASGITSDGQLLVDIDGAIQPLLTGDVSVRAAT
jgi:BirA family biotin operon repressor/biotin-[acetyl-CoA-carboxylase] ligase